MPNPFKHTLSSYLISNKLLYPIKTIHTTNKRIINCKINSLCEPDPLLDKDIWAGDILILTEEKRCYEVKRKGPVEVPYIFPIIREFINLWDPIGLIDREATNIDEYDSIVLRISTYIYTAPNVIKLSRLMNRCIERHFHDMFETFPWDDKNRGVNIAKGIIDRLNYLKFEVTSKVTPVIDRCRRKDVTFSPMNEISNIMFNLKNEFEKKFKVKCVGLKDCSINNHNFMAYEAGGYSTMFFEYIKGGPFIDAFFYADRMKAYLPNNEEIIFEYANPEFSIENIIKTIRKNEIEK